MQRLQAQAEHPVGGIAPDRQLQDLARDEQRAGRQILQILEAGAAGGVRFLAPETPGCLHALGKNFGLVFSDAQGDMIRIALRPHARTHHVEGQGIDGAGGMAIIGHQGLRTTHGHVVGAGGAHLLLLAPGPPVFHGSVMAAALPAHRCHPAGGQRHDHARVHAPRTGHGSEPAHQPVQQVGRNGGQGWHQNLLPGSMEMKRGSPRPACSSLLHLTKCLTDWAKICPWMPAPAFCEAALYTFSNTRGTPSR